MYGNTALSAPSPLSLDVLWVGQQLVQWVITPAAVLMLQPPNAAAKNAVRGGSLGSLVTSMYCNKYNNILFEILRFLSYFFLHVDYQKPRICQVNTFYVLPRYEVLLQPTHDESYRGKCVCHQALCATGGLSVYWMHIRKARGIQGEENCLFLV